MQFASDGYRLNGDPLTLVAPAAGQPSEVRVGDGGATSASWTTTIDNVLTGNGLEQDRRRHPGAQRRQHYTQGTRLSAGTLSVSTDANPGTAANGLTSGRHAARDRHGLPKHAPHDHLGRGWRRVRHRRRGQYLHRRAGPVRRGRAEQARRGRPGAEQQQWLYRPHPRRGRHAAGRRWRHGGAIAGDADVQAGATLAFKRSDRLVYGGALSGAANCASSARAPWC